jgi:hypothetical protein
MACTRAQTLAKEANMRIKSLLGFTARVTVVHFVTYFIFGLIFAFFNPFSPGQHIIHALTEFDCYFRPITDPLVSAGPLLQIVRGAILALALYPFRKVFLESKRGWLYLWGLFLALAIIAPSGACPGSIEGIAYTKLPLSIFVTGNPEVYLQTLAFALLVYAWERRREKKITIPLLVAFGVILLLSVLAVLGP